MPSTYSILSQTSLPSGQTLYQVQLMADNGYSETQQYIGDLTTLSAAQDHFNTTIMAKVTAEMLPTS